MFKKAKGCWRENQSKCFLMCFFFGSWHSIFVFIFIKGHEWPKPVSYYMESLSKGQTICISNIFSLILLFSRLYITVKILTLNFKEHLSIFVFGQFTLRLILFRTALILTLGHMLSRNISVFRFSAYFLFDKIFVFESYFCLMSINKENITKCNHNCILILKLNIVVPWPKNATAYE